MNVRTLIYGYGNPGRGDDGLGPEFARRLEDRALAGIRIERGYQLQVEDAATVADCDTVVFVDADCRCRDPFALRTIDPLPQLTWTSHAVQPEVVLGLARRIFGAHATGFALGIRGERFDDFGEGLSPRATRNLVAALEYFGRAMNEGVFDPAAMRAPDTEG